MNPSYPVRYCNWMQCTAVPETFRAKTSWNHIFPLHVFELPVFSGFLLKICHPACAGYSGISTRSEIKVDIQWKTKHTVPINRDPGPPCVFVYWSLWCLSRFAAPSGASRPQGSLAFPWLSHADFQLADKQKQAVTSCTHTHTLHTLTTHVAFRCSNSLFKDARYFLGCLILFYGHWTTTLKNWTIKKKLVFLCKP